MTCAPSDSKASTALPYSRPPAQYGDPCCCRSSSWQSGIMLRPAAGVDRLQRHLCLLLQVAVLGTGTFGTVLRAVDTSVPAGQRRQRKEVAIKLLPRGETGAVRGSDCWHAVFLCSLRDYNLSSKVSEWRGVLAVCLGTRCEPDTAAG